MNQAEVAKLMSQLRFKIQPSYRRLSQPKGPEGRLNKLRQTVTALIKYERLELYHPRADETRGYAERLISDAIRHGDTHKPTMEMASYWITEKQYVHKLFKVLAPRLQNCSVSYTRMYKAPQPIPFQLPDLKMTRTVLELRGHPFPPLVGSDYRNRNLLQNVLLDEAKKEYRKEKYAHFTAQLEKQNQENADKQPKTSNNVDEVKENDQK